MRDWFRFAPEFLRKSFMRADSASGTILGVVLVVISALLDKDVPRNLSALLAGIFVMEGTYAAFRAERLLRENRERYFNISAAAVSPPNETRSGGWLAGIDVRAKVTLSPGDKRSKVEYCMLHVYGRRRSWRSLFICKRRELITMIFGAEVPAIRGFAGFVDPEAASTGQCNVLPVVIDPEGRAVDVDLRFATRKGEFGPDGRHVSGNLEYEITGLSFQPRTSATCGLWIAPTR
ncbi:MAG: hypothetical protein WC273_00440 [Dehalococcoidia bacterium]